MSNLYGASQISSIDEAAVSNEILELFLIDDVLRGTQEDIKQFCESAEAQILMEKQVLNKPTLHRLSKEDDLKSRIKLISYQLVKESNDPNWAKLVKYQGLKKKYATMILKKYNKKAEKIAKIAQKEYIKKARSAKATASEKKAQAAK